METFKLAQPIREGIERAYGRRVAYPADCEHLAAMIEQQTGERIGVTTLKRIFGFVDDVKSPRLSTLDILARYAGFKDYDSMTQSLLGEGDSDFEENGDIRSSELQPGDRIRFEYLPDRCVRVRYLGEEKFVVEHSFGSRLKAGDLLKILGFAQGQPLKVQSVERNGKIIGRYTAGKVSGLTALVKES